MTEDEQAANRAISDRIAQDARTMHYKALDNETGHMVRELAKHKRFHEVEDALHVYGTYLEMHPEALEVLGDTNS